MTVKVVSNLLAKKKIYNNKQSIFEKISGLHYICINKNGVQQPKNSRDLYHHYCIMTKF